MKRILLSTLIAACGDDPDPCAGVAGSCLAIEVSSSTIEAIDQLELDVLYGDFHGTTSTQPAGGGTSELPLVTAIDLAVTAEGALAVGVVAAGKLSGVTLGTGAAGTTIEPGARATITIVLAPPAECFPSSFYCGGDKVAGDPETLYQCNGGGVPLARGVCSFGCVIVPEDDDFCRGGGGTCVEGSDYCGGNKLDGDPQTLYRCTGGVASNPRLCANGCLLRPGDDDICR